ncbi:MFS transporter [Erythrobacter sp. BLCC-B19]|uniref:MFS transporter n=1 Tax=Erythrobacter sp. BLCC-B19 TaxID=3025315 RepID=UPI00235E096A|nr:MFS transporter [Erythrobacter sp. BLCC-B19]WDA41394.1 MFS transporter [Erythrobacter sp. BLCC-B19]
MAEIHLSTPGPMPTDAPAPARPSLAYAWYTLGVLVVVTLFAFIDRQVIILLAEQIKIAFRLSDMQLGFLQGTAVAMFSAVAAYPLAWAADRIDRRLVLAVCITVWSLAVVCCGLAQSYTQILIATAMVAAAEAGLAPMTFAIIPELFPPEKRQLANSIFALVSVATGSIALALGGAMIAGVGAVQPSLPPELAGLEVWRLSFFAVALPAPFMIALLYTARLGGRGKTAEEEAQTQETVVQAGSLKDFLLGRGAAMLRLYGALGIANFGYQALLAWVVVIGLRAFSQTEAEVGAAIGLAALVATPVGFAMSLLLTRLFAERVGPAFPVRLLMFGYLVSGPVLGLLWLAPSAEVFYAIIFVGYAINITMGMILPTAIQSLAPPALRARAISVNFVVNVLLASLAAPLVGFLSDSFGSEPRVILTSALMITVPSLIVAGLVLLTAQKAFAEALAEARARGEAA